MRIGVKQFSDKLQFFKDALIKMYEENDFDYVELFVHPANMEYLSGWVKLKSEYNIPFSIHAPHFSQGCNLADKSFFDYNKMVYEQVNTYAKALEAEYTVVHGGMDGDVEEIIRQASVIKPYKMRIENKPYVAPRNPDKMVCRGATPEEIKYIKDNLGCGFNYDVGHSFCAAVSLKIDQYEIIKQFEALKPDSYHLSDGEFDNRIDIHYHLGNGDYDWAKILPMIDDSKNWTLETIKKNETSGLDLVKKDIAFLRKLS